MSAFLFVVFIFFSRTGFVWSPTVLNYTYRGSILKLLKCCLSFLSTLDMTVAPSAVCPGSCMAPCTVLPSAAMCQDFISPWVENGREVCILVLVQHI